MGMKLKDLDPASRAECKLAIRWAYKPIPDTDRGKGWYKFIHDNLTIYRAAPKWISAEWVDGQYINRVQYATLAEAVHRGD